MSTSRQKSCLVQKLITSYFPRPGLDARLLSASIQVDSLYCLVYSESSLSGYVSETPVFKLGNIDFYLGRCNTVDESPRKRLFRPSLSVESGFESLTSFGLVPTPSQSVIECPGSPTESCEFIVAWR